MQSTRHFWLLKAPFSQARLISNVAAMPELRYQLAEEAPTTGTALTGDSD